MRFKSNEQAEQHHIDNYRSDGVSKGRYNWGTSEYHLGRFIVQNVTECPLHLDIGANAGTIGKMLVRERGAYVKGIEIVQDLVDKCNANGIPCSQGSASDLSRFDSETFDSVSIIEVLEHMHDPSGGLQEAFRVLKHKHHLIASFPVEETLGDYHNKLWGPQDIDDLFSGLTDSFLVMKIPCAITGKIKWHGVIARKMWKTV